LVDRLRFDELPIDGNDGDLSSEDTAGPRTSDFPLEMFNGVDSSSGLKPPRKSSSSKSDDPPSSCIICRILACRGRRLKLLSIELSKAGVPWTLEPLSPLRPAMERVEEYPRALVCGRLPVTPCSVPGDDPIANSCALLMGVWFLSWRIISDGSALSASREPPTASLVGEREIPRDLTVLRGP
jgi:hypothetical protein